MYCVFHFAIVPPRDIFVAVVWSDYLLTIGWQWQKPLMNLQPTWQTQDHLGLFHHTLLSTF
jgi:hypothetical protein